MKRSGFRRPELPARPAYVFGPPPAHGKEAMLREIGASARPPVEPIRKATAKPEPRYLAWLRTLPCVCCGGPGGVAHHQHGEKGTMKGMGLRAPDSTAVPLCERCHNGWHAMGHFSGRTRGESVELMQRARSTLRAAWERHRRRRPTVVG